MPWQAIPIAQDPKFLTETPIMMPINNINKNRLELFKEAWARNQNRCNAYVDHLSLPNQFHNFLYKSSLPSKMKHTQLSQWTTVPAVSFTCYTEQKNASQSLRPNFMPLAYSRVSKLFTWQTLYTESKYSSDISNISKKIIQNFCRVLLKIYGQ